MIDTKAYTEVYYIINCLSALNKEKIPEEIRKNIESKMDKNYIFNVDINNIKNIQLLDDTKRILSILYTDYFASDEERNAIKAKELAIAISKEEEIKKEQINQYEIKFDKNVNNTSNDKTECKNLVEYKTSYFKRMLERIKKIFKK